MRRTRVRWGGVQRARAARTRLDSRHFLRGVDGERVPTLSAPARHPQAPPGASNGGERAQAYAAGATPPNSRSFLMEKTERGCRH